ncbi:MAG: TIGR01212 family radical SAM protein, partial [Bacilli bacterium]
NFSCPNIDGTVGIGGCIYCSKLGSGDFAGNVNENLETQFYNIKKTLDKKWPNLKYIAYFQANSNTYAPLTILKKKYEQVLKIKNVVGLSIATRCDCITDECLNYLEQLNKKTYLTIELGLQTIHENTAQLINRCHSLKTFENMVKKLRQKNINVVVHIINGLPYETPEMMIKTAKYLNNIDIQGIKIHMLYILKNTKISELYNETNFSLLTKEQYVSIVVKQIENLNPNIVINRLTGDANDQLIAPIWITKKITVLNDIDKLLAKKDTFQGKKKTK